MAKTNQVRKNGFYSSLKFPSIFLKSAQLFSFLCKQIKNIHYEIKFIVSRNGTTQYETTPEGQSAQLIVSKHFEDFGFFKRRTAFVFVWKRRPRKIFANDKSHKRNFQLNFSSHIFESLIWLWNYGVIKVVEFSLKYYRY